MPPSILERTRSAISGLFAAPRVDVRTERRLLRETALADPLQLFGPEDFPKYNPSQLVGRNGLEIFDKMMQDDQIKAAMIFRRQATTASGWTIEGGGERSEDWEPAVFVRHVFERMNCSVDLALFSILSAMAYGYSVTEVVYEEIETGPFKGRIGIKALKTRRPHEFEFKTDQHGNILPDGVLQRNNKDGLVPMPRAKFVVYSHGCEFQNPYGKSELEAAYRPWWISDNAMKWLAMMLERFGVPPVAVLYQPDKFGVAQIEALKKALQNLQAATSVMIPRQNKESMEMWAPELAGQVSSVFIPALEALDRSKARALLMPGLLGVTPDQLGSHARARVIFDVFMLSVQAAQAVLADAVMTEQVIRPLMALNYGTDEIPVFRFKELTDDAQSELMDMWTSLIHEGAVKPGPADESYIRELLNFPPGVDPDEPRELGPADISGELLESGVLTVNEVREAYGLPPLADGDQRLFATVRGGLRNDRVAQAQDGTVDGTDEGNATTDARSNAIEGRKRQENPEPNQSGNEKPVVASRERTSGRLAAEPPVTAVRNATDDPQPIPPYDELSPAAKRVDLAALDQRLEARERDTIATVSTALLRELQKLPPEWFSKARPSWRMTIPPSATLALRRLMTKSWRDGGADLRAEVAKAPGAEGRFDGEVGWEPKAALDWLETRLGMTIKGLEEVLSRTVTTEIMNGLRAGLPYREIASRVGDALAPLIGATGRPVTPTRIEIIVRTVATEAYNQGRLITARRLPREFVPGMEIVAVLDRRTTDICRHLDGKKFRIDDPDLDRYTPPNHYRCRTILASITIDIAPPEDGWISQAERARAAELMPGPFGGSYRDPPK